MKSWDRESGVIELEASIYFPIVIFTVFAMIYFGMVKYQESILTFEVDKLAVMGAREAAYPGYENFAADNSLQSSAVDFLAGSDLRSKVKPYYEDTTDHLYHEWQFQYGGTESLLEGTLEEMLHQKSFLTGVETFPDVEIKSYVIGRQITVSATYGLKSPKFLSYIGVPLDLTLKTTVKKTASNPTELVRNIDMATDLIDFFLEKFHMKGRVDTFLKKITDVKDKIL